MLNDSADWLNSMLGSVAGVAVTYTRGAETLSFAASDESITVGDARFQESTEGGAKIAHGDRIYLIVADAIADFGEPQEGDRIAETVGGEDCVFEVAPPGTGEPAARWSDVTRTCWRVHCKRVL